MTGHPRLLVAHRAKDAWLRMRQGETLCPRHVHACFCTHSRQCIQRRCTPGLGPSMPTWRSAPLGKVPKFAPTYQPKMQLSHFLRRLAACTPFCHGQKKLQLYAGSAHGRSSVWIVSEVCILFDMRVDRGSLKLQALLHRTILQAGAHA